MNSFYNHYYQYYKPYTPNILHDDSSTKVPNNENSKKKSPKYSSFGPVHFKNLIFSDIEEPIFEIFGIELYLDDIIILGLLFFLYQENVQDEMLFIVLILLLVS